MPIPSNLPAILCNCNSDFIDSMMNLLPSSCERAPFFCTLLIVFAVKSTSLTSIKEVRISTAMANAPSSFKLRRTGFRPPLLSLLSPNSLINPNSSSLDEMLEIVPVVNPVILAISERESSVFILRASSTKLVFIDFITS